MNSIFLVRLHNLPWKGSKSPYCDCTIYLRKDQRGLASVVSHFFMDEIDYLSNEERHDLSKATTPQPFKDGMNLVYLVRLHNLPYKGSSSPQCDYIIYLGRDQRGLSNAITHFSNDGINITSTTGMNMIFTGQHPHNLL